MPYDKNHPGPPNPPPGLKPYHCGWFGHLTRNCPVNRGGCGRHFRKGEPDYENPYCPDCGTHRYCLRNHNRNMTVCHIHGGGSPNKGRPGGLNKKYHNDHVGRFAKVLMDTDYYEEYEKALADPRYLELKEMMALARSRHKALAEKMADTKKSRDSLAAWQVLEGLIKTLLNERQTIVNTVSAMIRAFNAQDKDGIKKHMETLVETSQNRTTLNQMEQALRDGLGDWAIKKDLREEEEHYRRMTAEERRLYVDSQRMVKMEKVDLILSLLLDRIEDIIDEPQKMVAIGVAVRNLLGGEVNDSQIRHNIPVIEGTYAEQ